MNWEEAAEGPDPKRIDYQNLFENSVAPMFRTAPNGEFLLVNKTLAKLLGYETSEELLASQSDVKNELFVVPETSGNSIEGENSERVIKREGTLARRDGEIIRVSIHARVVFDEDGTPSYSEGILLDITDWRKWEEGIARTVGGPNQFARTESVSPTETRFKNLSKRETQIVRAILDGSRVNTIARSLDLAPNTVRQHLQSAFKKLGIRSQEKLIEQFKGII